MNKVFLILIATLILMSCESREKKIQMAISQELKGVLYSFDSYEPIKTKIDSAYSTPYIDPMVKDLILSMGTLSPELEKATIDYNNALSHIALWNTNSAFSRQQREEAIFKRDAAKNRILAIQSQLKSIMKELYTRVNEDNVKDKEFIGWFVTQRYKCNTRGGYPDFGDDVFVFNENITDCIFYMSSKDYETLCNYVDQILSVPEDEFIKALEDVNLLVQ